VNGPRLMSLLALLLCVSACSSDSDEPDGTSGQGGGGGQSSSGTGGGGTSGASGSGGSGGGASGASGNGGSSSGSGGTGGAAANGGANDAATANVGVCGQRGEAMVNATTFTGFEERYVIADEGFGDDICVVRFETMRVGDAPEGCDDPTAGVDCLWTHMVELTSPTIVTDVDGACAKSGFGLDAEAIAELDGSRAAYGFVSEFAGHNSVVLRYDEAMGDWSPYGNGTWVEAAEMFRFDHRDGLCDY
jgi:hypothetical protein